LFETARPALDLQRQQLAADRFTLDDLHLSVDAVVLGGLLAEQPVEFLLDGELRQGHADTRGSGR